MKAIEETAKVTTKQSRVIVVSSLFIIQEAFFRNVEFFDRSNSFQ